VLLARWLAGGLMFHQLDCVALLVSLVAVTLLAGGWQLARSCAPAVAFLIFMVPLPYELERNVGGPLKEVATAGSTYLLQTLGLPAVAEGHVILIDEVRLGVVDACSGLKMLMTFSAFAAGAVLTLGRTKFENLLVLLGVVPIAVLTNVLRITATGVAYTLVSDKNTQHFLHDLHGWLMMPVGLALLAAQLWCLGRLVEQPAPAATAHAYTPLRPSFA
jgi:exosortase